MVGAFLIPSEPPINLSNLQGASNQGPFNLTPVTDSLGLTRNFCTAVDVCYGKSKIFFLFLFFLELIFIYFFFLNRWTIFDRCFKWCNKSSMF